jgi:hypothetical protein
VEFVEWLWHLYIRQISFLQVCVSCSGNVKKFYRRFGHEKNIVCWAFLVARGRKEVVTYGIRAGSTRDLGFATAFVDMSGFYYTVVD